MLVGILIHIMVHTLRKVDEIRFESLHVNPTHSIGYLVDCFGCSFRVRLNSFNLSFITLMTVVSSFLFHTVDC